MDASQSAALFDASRDALGTLTPSGEIVALNAAAAAMLGVPRERALARSLGELLAEENASSPLSARLDLARLRGAVRFDVARRAGDGSPMDLDVELRHVRGADPELFTFHMRDATELHRLRQGHAASGKFPELLESAPDAMVVLGADGRIALVNARTEELFGRRRDELLGQYIEILVPERYRGAHPGLRAGYLATARPRPMGAGLELYALRKDGTEFPAEISLSPVTTPAGTFVAAAIRDASERKHAAEVRRKAERLEEQNMRMQEANRMKTEFLANMSHELRTPLNAIIGFADLMHRGKVGPVSAEHAEYLGDILTSSRHLLQLINEVLDLARIETGKMAFHHEPVDLDALVSEVRDILRTLTAARRLDLRVAIDPRARFVVADASRLKQVLYNYLSNAIKFSHEGGSVDVKVTPADGDAFRIDVVDAGIGIRQEDLGKLFVEFQQLDAGPSKRYQGTGLGLAVTKRIVEAQGGTVGVRSTHGEGSSFWAELPSAKAGGGDGR